MSAILKALQKLERDTLGVRRREDPLGALRHLVPQKMAGRSRGLLIRNTAFAVFVAVFLGVVSWSLWRYPLLNSRSTLHQTSPLDGDSYDSNDPSSSIDMPLPPSTLKSFEHAIENRAESLKKPSTPSSDHSLPAAEPPHTPERPQITSLSAVSPDPQKIPAASVRPVQSDAVPRTLPLKQIQGARSVPTAQISTQPADKRPQIQNRLSTTAPSSTENHDDLPVKSQDDAGIAIQALVWSAAPENRLVVVNGNILKEGGSIEDATISTIGEDYIVVKKNGERWKLKFQLK